jgi:hypothetical protein
VARVGELLLRGARAFAAAQNGQRGEGHAVTIPSGRAGSRRPAQAAAGRERGRADDARVRSPHARATRATGFLLVLQNFKMVYFFKTIWKNKNKNKKFTRPIFCVHKQTAHAISHGPSSFSRGEKTGSVITNKARAWTSLFRSDLQ